MKNVILFLFFGNGFSAYGIQTARDLTNTYHTLQTKLSALEKQLSVLPAAVQQPLKNELQTIAKQITTMYTETMQKIASWENQTTNFEALMSLNKAVVQSQETLNDIVFSIDTKISEAIKTYQEHQKEKQASTISKKTEALIKAQEAYEKKINRLVSKLMQLVPEYNQIEDKIQQFFNQFLMGKPYVEHTVEQFSNQLDVLAQKAYNLYKKVGPIYADDRTQLLNSIIRSIINLYLQIQYQMVQKIQKMPINNAYFKALSDLSIKVIGTQNNQDSGLIRDGFDTSLQNIIAKYYDGTDRKKMFYYYLQKKVNTTFVIYNYALTQLVVQAGTAPTQEQLSFALQLYAFIMEEIKQIDEPAQTNNAASNANMSVAILYANIGLALIKSLQIDQNTEPVRQQIITNFKKASSYFTQASKTADSQNNYLANAQNYIGLYTKLMQADQMLTDAQNAYTNGDQTKAISLYTKVQQLFLQAGDKVDANKIGITLSTILGNYAIKNATNLYNQFTTKNSALTQEYINFINSFDTSVIMKTFDTFLNELINLYQHTYLTLAPAIQAYQTVIKNNPTLSQSSQTISLLQNLNDGVSLVTSLSQAQFNLLQGDQQLAGLSSTALLQADQYYNQALQLFGQADTLYKNNKELSQYLPPFFVQNKTIIDFTTIAQRHIAKLAIQYANGLSNNPVLALIYYNEANMRFNYLMPVVDSFITTTLSMIAKSIPSLTQLLANEQAVQKKLKSLSASSWAPKTTAAYYSSQATVQWDNLLQQYLLLYHLGYKEAKDDFIDAVNNYASLYKQFVPEEFFSEIGIALIHYMNYLLLISEKESTQSVQQEIDQHITSFFDRAYELLNTSHNPASLSTTATTDQAMLIRWIAIADNAIQKQENIQETMGLGLSGVTLLEKKVDNQGNLTYTALPIKKTITIPNPSLYLALLYKQLGDLYLNQKNYMQAYPCYYQAKLLYLKENQPAIIAEFSDQLSIANALYLATEYRDLVIPKGSITLTGIAIPESFEIKVYGQTVPIEFTSGVDFKELKTPKMVTDFLISLASKMYIYNKLSEMFPGFDFDTLFPLFSLSYNQLMNNSTFQSFIPEQQSAFISILTNALLFNNQLQKRVETKLSSLSLQFVGVHSGMPQYGLYEYYVPMPPFVDKITYYQSYPAAIEYYICAASLYRPTNFSGNIQICQPTLPAGNDPEQYKEMLEAQVHTYLNQGYDFQKQLDTLTSTTTWKALKQIASTNMKVKLDSYMPLYNEIKNLFNQMVAYYNGPMSSNLITEQSKEYAQLVSLLLESYKNCGDMLATFLVGDPLYYNYTQVLKDMLANYVIAIVTYKNSSDLYGTMADYYLHAGTILTDKKKYFDSLSYFFTAINLYQRITAPTDSLKKSITKAQVSYYDAMVKGSTYNLSYFQKTQKGLIDIVLSDGTREKISFTDLMTKYLQFLSQQGGVTTVNLDPAEKDMADRIKNYLLDAMIYYSGCNSLIMSHGAQTTDPSLLVTLIPDENERATVNQQALELINSFTEKNKVALDNLTTITSTLNKTDFPDGKDFVALMLNGFNQFKEKIERTTDVTTQAIGYSAIAQLALKLYTFLEFLYMDIFLGGPSVAAETNLATAIQVEVNQILAPSSQYIG